MTGFQQANAVLLLAGFVLTVGAILSWVYLSRQQEVPRTSKYALKLMARVAILFAIFWVFCEGLKVSAVLVMLAALVGPFAFALVLDEVGIASTWVLRQFILGFPARNELVRSSVAPDDTKAKHLPRELIGRTGVAISPLRPMGLIMIDGKRYDAVSEDGTFIDAEAAVQVHRINGHKLLVLANP